MSLLDEIKLDLLKEKAKLTNTLRKAKILASQLQGGEPQSPYWGWTQVKL